MRIILITLVLLFNFYSFGQNHEIIVPNSFTPNKEINKEFYPITNSNYKMEIYNRWGKLIFNGEKWDGKENNIIPQNGTYIWLIYIEDRKYLGHINIIN